MNITTRIGFACMLVLLMQYGYGHQAPKPLTLNESVSGELAADGIDVYSLEAQKGHFVYGYVNQISVDVVVSILDPEGKKIGTFDVPARGAENFTIETEVEGKYTLEVESFKENKGSYEILLVSIEPIATDPAGRVDQLLSAYDNDETPGAIVGVVHNGKIVFSKGYGMANLVHGIPFTPDLSSNIGSVSKQFTAMAILLLEKEGKLSLDDDVRTHIPELPDFGETITLKNLLNHTNGLREIYNTMPMTGWKGEDVLRREEAIYMIQRQHELQDSPGETYNYNNTAFIFLANIVERITGEKFPDWMQANVFEPLGMENTLVRPHPAFIIPNSTQGYTHGEQGFQEAGDLYAAYGAGGMYTTVADLSNWLNNFNTGELGGKKLVEKLVTPGIFTNGDTMKYALGIGVSSHRGLKRYQHGGADIAHRAMLAYYPELNAGVMVMSNNGSFNSGVASKIAEAFFEDEMEPKKAEKQGGENRVKVDPEILKSYVGKYKMETAAFVIEYKFEEEQLVAHPQGQPSLALAALTDSSFSYTDVDATVVFHKSADGEIESATHHQGGNAMKLNKLAPYSPDAEALRAYNGLYFSEELQTHYRILVEEDELLAQHFNMKDITLSPVSEDEFSGNVFFFGEVKFMRSEQGEVIGFTASNGRTKNVLFAKQDEKKEVDPTYGKANGK